MVKRAPKRKRRSIGTLVAAELRAYWPELLGGVLVVSSIFALVSLYSFYPFDTTLFYVRSFSEPTHNWCGIVGAHLAAYLLYYSGGVAYGIVGIVLFVGGLLVVRGEWRLYAIPLFFASVGLIAFAGVLRGHAIDVASVPPGGVLGRMVYYTLRGSIGRVGALIVFYGLMWIALIGTLRISFVHVGVLIGRTAWCMSVAFWRGSVWIVRRVYTGVGVLVAGKRDSDTSSVGSVDVHSSPSREPKTRTEQVLDFWQTIEEQASVREHTLDHDNIPHDDEYDDHDYDEVTDDARDIIQMRPHVVEVAGLPVTWLRNTVVASSPRFVMNTLASPSHAQISYTLPDISLFEQPMTTEHESSRAHAEEVYRGRAAMLQEKLKHFGIYGEVTAIRPGPVVTLFEYTPEIGTKISKIIALEDDLALALKAHSIRIIAPIPGKSVVGFEISNEKRRGVRLVDVISHEIFTQSTAALPLVLGVDLVGEPVVDDLLSMPHLLVAGSTGSGKSVGLNSMLMSLLLTRRPDELKLILVDPKRLEFSLYDSIPHLLFPIVTDPRKVPNILRWVVQEMERRYEIMAYAGVRNVVDFNRWASRKKRHEALPYIVLVIDELADVMMVAGKEVEHYVTRIAQMARAAGIHMIIATQRPSVDVVTGLIKVNFPSRVSFRVSSKVDSKTILDMAGAEKLLGRGDMLYTDPRSIHVRRIHGPYVSEKEIKAVTEFLRAQAQPHYEEEALAVLETNMLQEDRAQPDELYMQVLEYVKSMREVSISMLQRKFRIGFNRSARLIDTLEQRGVIAPAQGAKPRKVLITS